MKKLALLAALLPLAAFAQTPGATPRAGGPGPGTDERIEKMEKRARLARNLGLAEALDLDTAQATKLADALQKLDDKRIALHKQMRDVHLTLRRAASGEKVTAAEVDAAVAKGLDIRTQDAALDKEVVGVVTQGLSPEKKARAVLFLGRFGARMGGPGGGPGMGMGPGMHGGPGMMGMGGRHGPGMGDGPGMGRGGMGPGDHSCPNCPWDDDDDQR
jgi:hypothetical protein